jgi:hypothetical protein
MYTFFLVQQLSGAPFFTTSSKLFFGQTKIKHKYGCQKKSYPTVLVSVSYKSGIERTEKKKTIYKIPSSVNSDFLCHKKQKVNWSQMCFGQTRIC